MIRKLGKIIAWAAFACVVGFLAIILAGAALGASEQTQWTIAIGIFALWAIYLLNDEREKRDRYRSEVLHKIREIHSQLGLNRTDRSHWQ